MNTFANWTARHPKGDVLESNHSLLARLGKTGQGSLLSRLGRAGLPLVKAGQNRAASCQGWAEQGSRLSMLGRAGQPLVKAGQSRAASCQG